MTVGICAPVDTRPLARYVDAGADALPAGIGGTPITALVRAAVECGWRVMVFSLDASISEERIAAGPQLKICMGPYRPKHRARDLFAAERSYLAGAIQREKPDVLHAHWTYEFALGALATGRPSLITAHDCPFRVLRWDHSPYRIVRTCMAAMVARRARRLTAVSDAVAAHYRRFLQWRGAIPIIPNGLEPEWFDSSRDPAAPGGFTFLAVLQGWGPLKNGRRLLEAFALVRRDLPDARLVLAGHGHGPGEEAETWAQRHGVAAGVEFAGQIERSQLRRRMGEAGVLVHPSREESYSMVVAEAMACGLPVIAGRTAGSIAASLDGGHDAVLVDENSPSQLASSMLRLAYHPELRAGLAARARSAAAREFPVARVWAAYAGLYAHLED